ncbi:MAG: hypothetical protein JEZ07_09155 [Phycisphaerae bacterium]|nr:hypothetical protein [Phycisphaerae bacterium]
MKPASRVIFILIAICAVLKAASPSKPGLWSHIPMFASAGRIYDLELNPDNPDEIYANPDNDGIFITVDGGRHWEPITDNIPDRFHRNNYVNIIVDPLDFKHVFSISRKGQLYETQDQGKSWAHNINQGHKDGRAPQFKWVEAFRDSHNNLILIGTVPNSGGANPGFKPGLYRSANSGISWEYIDLVPESFDKKKGLLQEIAFHKSKKDIVYLAGRARLYISTDAGLSFKLLKEFTFESEDEKLKIFQPMFISTLYGPDADALYAAVSIGGSDTQVYYSPDMGKSWQLRQDSINKTGYPKGIFGNASSSSWTSFFEVDPFDKNHLIASSVGSCESYDGGVNWEFQSWAKRPDAVYADGTIGISPHGGHNADNHVLKFHPKLQGFKVKGCDAGIMRKVKDHQDNWTNINGDIPAFLWYSIVVNEFGDRYIAGNTQDVNIQTYRYGSWDNEIGYEGDTIFINPYTNITYFPCSPIEKGEGLDFFEQNMWVISSWGCPRTAVNYYEPSRLLISFPLRIDKKTTPKHLYQSTDYGMSFSRVPNLDQEVYASNISRTSEPLLTIFTRKSIMTSQDMGQTWQEQLYPQYFKAQGGTKSVCGAVNPDKPNEVWAGARDGKVIASSDGGKTWNDLSAGLPEGQVTELCFHEGSAGDLYALVKGFGIYYKAENAKEWILWNTGYPLIDFSEIRIDYPSQQLLGASYGRGLWQATLMHPCERFYKNGFAIQQFSDIQGIKTFGIDSELVTPDYYNYQWFINGKEAGSNKPILTLGPGSSTGDKVKLKISPRRYPDISTESAEIEIQSKARALDNHWDSSLELAKGCFVDLGIVELFSANEDFTFELTARVKGSGIIAGNRRHFYRDAKGWYLKVDDKGEVSLFLSPRQNRNLSKTTDTPKEQAFIIKTEPGKLIFDQWAQIAFTVSKTGLAILYIDGEKAGAIQTDNAGGTLSLNNVLRTTLLADPFGQKPIAGAIRNVRIWNKCLSSFNLNLNRSRLITTDGLIYYINFHADRALEQFTNKTARIITKK